MTASISARTIEALTAIATAVNDLADAVRETGRARVGRIATQEPAGEPEGGSAGRGASGGLGERLRALGTGQTRTLRKVLRAIADEVDEVEVAYRVADAEIARLSEFHDHYRAQVEAIRAAIRREAAHGEAITHCNLVAERFQTVLDSVAPTTENPFRMPEDRCQEHGTTRPCRWCAGNEQRLP